MKHLLHYMKQLFYLLADHSINFVDAKRGMNPAPEDGLKKMNINNQPK